MVRNLRNKWRARRMRWGSLGAFTTYNRESASRRDMIDRKADEGSVAQHTPVFGEYVIAAAPQ